MSRLMGTAWKAPKPRCMMVAAKPVADASTSFISQSRVYTTSLAHSARCSKGVATWVWSSMRERRMETSMCQLAM
eukprot:3932427-Rhodomonas_salina.1